MYYLFANKYYLLIFLRAYICAQKDSVIPKMK